MILLAFFFPVSIYLLVLGNINSRSRPLVVSGVWDFIGLLGAVSGFLMVGGPVLLGSFQESWRAVWMNGQPPGDGISAWGLISLLYFFAVLVVCGFMLRQQRRLTAIYNVSPDTIERLLERICDQFELKPTRSGHLFLFGPSMRQPEDAAASQQDVILEVVGFRPMWHVTLRWDPANAMVRQAIEKELEATLAETFIPEHELGPRITLAGMAMFTACVSAVMAMILYYSIF